MGWIILGILGLATAIKTIGAVQQTEAQAAADTLKAGQLNELSKAGGYYDQELSALNAELTNVQADREAAGKMMGITAAQYQQQEVQTARQGAQATGSITAAAGAANLAQTGSIEQRKGIVAAQTQESMASIERNIESARLSYESQLRGLTTKQAQITAQTTLTQFNKAKGTQDAAALTSESEWLKTWGVGLDIATGVVGFAGQLVGMNFPVNAPTSTTPTAKQTSSDYAFSGDTNPDPYSYMGGYDQRMQGLYTGGP